MRRGLEKETWNAAVIHIKSHFRELQKALLLLLALPHKDTLTSFKS